MRLLDHSVPSAEHHEAGLVSVEAAHREGRLYALALGEVQYIDESLAPGRSPELGQLVHLEPMHPAAGGKEQNVKDFVRILQGKEKGAKTDLVAINAGASLYSLGDVKTLKAGTKKAQKILADGTGYEILKKLIAEIGSSKLLEKWE